MPREGKSLFLYSLIIIQTQNNNLTIKREFAVFLSLFCGFRQRQSLASKEVSLYKGARLR